MYLDPKRYEIVDDAMVEVLRTKAPDERLAMADSMWRMARDLIRGKLRQDHPEWSDEQLAQETARRLSRGAFPSGSATDGPEQVTTASLPPSGD